MKKWLFSTFYFLFSLFYFIKPVQAAEFSTSYEITYQVNEKGTTTVINEVNLTNLKSDLYAKEYNVLIGSKAIENISGFDSLGPLELEVSQNNESTEIKAVFNERVVGKGKILNFTLLYETSEIANQQGRIWEISIPKPTMDKSISSYTINLLVPKSFGQAAYLKPKPISGLRWVFDQSLSSPINAAFGDYQSYDFDLSYHLRNNSLVPGIYQIPLPPDTSFQKVRLETLSPQAQNIILDEDGNWLAQYQLLPQQTIQITAQGAVFVFSEKREDFLPLAQFDYQKYLTEKKYWEKNDQEITALAQELKTPQKIYQYVVNTLSYDTTRISEENKRLGAKKILQEPEKATCMEFTDLFIALCRAAGVPAREINGFGFSEDPVFRPFSLTEDILHAWPEYFDADKQIWIPVDPTWEKTTKGVDYFHNFDFHHVVFTIHGLASDRPAPPGAYSKNLNEREKNVKVDFSDKEKESATASSELLARFPQQTLAGNEVKGQVEISNPNSEAIYNLALDISSSKLLPDHQEFKILILPPFSHQVFDLQFPCPNIFFRGENKFVFKLNGLEKEVSIFIQPLLIGLLPYLLGFCFTFIFLVLCIFLFKKNRNRKKQLTINN